MAAHRPTISDVAKRAGVSKATVSRVLNGTTPVVPRTEQAVRAAIKEVGYVTSWSARALAKGSAEAIGVFFSEPFAAFGADPTFHVQMEGIFQGLEDSPYTPLIVQASSTVARRKAIRLIESGLLDAVVHLTPYVDDALLACLRDAHLPTVLCSRLADSTWDDIFSTVFADDIIGAELGAAHMRDMGVKKPVVIMGPIDNPAAAERVEGIRHIYPHMDADRIFHAGWDESSGHLGVIRFLREELAFDGVICGSDRIASGVLESLARAGLAVPTDVRVIGFDDHPLAQHTSPTLTTVAQPMLDEGRKAAELALEMIGGAKPQIFQLPMTLRVRQSTTE